jgi:hypothetical protein
MSSASKVSPSVNEAQENPELVEINNCVRDTLASLDIEGIEFFIELNGETLMLTLQTKKFLEAQDLAVQLGKQIEQIAPANILELAVYKRKTAENKAFLIKEMALDKRRSAKPDRVATNPAPNSHSTPIPTKSPQQDRLSSPPNPDHIEQQVREICTNLDLGTVEFFIEIENETLSIIIQTKEFLEAQDLAENLGKQIEQIAPAGIRELAVYKRKNAETKAFLVNKMAVNKHDEPEEEINIMTNSPNPTPNPYRRRRLSAFDELIAIVVALTGIGMVFFWGIGQKYRQLNLEGGISNLSENKVGLLGSGKPILSNPTGKTIASGAKRDRHNPQSVTTIPSPAPTTIVKTIASGAKRDRHNPQPVTTISSPAPTTIVKTIASFAERDRHNPQPVTTIPSPAPTTIVKTVEVPAEPPKTTGPAPVAVAPVVQPTVVPPAKPVAKTPEFTDVPKQFWGETYITELQKRGILDDFGSGKFDPSKPITRGEYAKMLDRAFADRPATTTTANFKDIPSDYPRKEAIYKSVQLGFMTGYSPTKFFPNQKIPRFQLQISLAKGMKLNPPANTDRVLSKFTDAKKMPKYAREKMAAAVDAGLTIKDQTKNLLKPVKTATRADAAALIYQALVKEGKIQPQQKP